MNMNTTSRIALFTLLTLFSCANKQEEKFARKQNRAEAIRLHDSAMKLIPDYSTAIILLDKAINQDSNSFDAHYHKMNFHVFLKQYDKALTSAKEVIRIKPDALENYSTAVELCYKVGDYTSGMEYTRIAQEKYINSLDATTINKKSDKGLLLIKATNLIFSGKEKEGNIILEQMYDKETDVAFKKQIAFFMNKSRKQILEQYAKGIKKN